VLAGSPRLQYCCFRELARRLDLAAPAELFDPVMTASEIAVAAADGIRAPRVNEAAKRKCHGDPTVFFMPHCGKELYDNLLWANWTVPHVRSLFPDTCTRRGSVVAMVSPHAVVAPLSCATVA
jgi:hypothetical protein